MKTVCDHLSVLETLQCVLNLITYEEELGEIIAGFVQVSMGMTDERIPPRSQHNKQLVLIYPASAPSYRVIQIRTCRFQFFQTYWKITTSPY